MDPPQNKVHFMRVDIPTCDPASRQKLAYDSLMPMVRGLASIAFQVQQANVLQHACCLDAATLGIASAAALASRRLLVRDVAVK